LQTILCTALLISSYLIVFFFNFSWVEGRPKGVMSSFGSLHSGKYSFLAEYASQCSAIPAINHNVGQSIASSMIKALSGNTHTYILSWLLFLSILGFLLFSWGLIENLLTLRLSKFWLILTGFLVLFGNFALSSALVLINDSGNPIALVGYSDTIFGLFAFLYLISIGFSQHLAHSLRRVFVLSIIFVALIYSAPQILILIPIAIIYKVFKRNYSDLRKLVSSLILSLLVWRGQSGLLAPLGAESVVIPGFSTLKFEQSLFSSESLSPGFPFLVGSFSSFPFEINPKALDSSKDFVASVAEGEISRALWNLEQVFLSTLRPIFWPLMGFAVIFVLLRRRRKPQIGFVKKIQLMDTHQIVTMFIYSMFYFIVTFPLTFMFKINGLKWEMTRFTFPGLVVGMFFIILIFTALLQSAKRKATMVLFAAILTFPAIVHVSAQVSRNLKHIEFSSYQTEVGRVGVLEEEIIVPCK